MAQRTSNIYIKKLYGNRSAAESPIAVTLLQQVVGITPPRGLWYSCFIQYGI